MHVVNERVATFVLDGKNTMGGNSRERERQYPKRGTTSAVKERVNEFRVNSHRGWRILFIGNEIISF